MTLHEIKAFILGMVSNRNGVKNISEGSDCFHDESQFNRLFDLEIKRTKRETAFRLDSHQYYRPQKVLQHAVQTAENALNGLPRNGYPGVVQAGSAFRTSAKAKDQLPKSMLMDTEIACTAILFGLYRE